jgi:hypothetical protein
MSWLFSDQLAKGPDDCEILFTAPVPRNHCEHHGQRSPALTKSTRASLNADRPCREGTGAMLRPV